MTTDDRHKDCAQTCQQAVRYGVDGVAHCSPHCVDKLHEEQECIDLARVAFENHAYAHHLQRKAAGKVDPTAEGDGSREALFWKQPDGSYGVLMFNAAWQGFKWGRGLP